MVTNRKVLITGANGQLGSALKYLSVSYNNKYFFSTKKDLDITDFPSVLYFLQKHKIDTIINCAALTDVKFCESNPSLANEVNSKAVQNMAELCSRLKKQLIHISTDYVFDGNKKLPYLETDKTNPINNYGLSKLRGENGILKYNLRNSAIIRTSWLYSNSDNNFVSKIIKKIKNKEDLKVINYEMGSPTNCFDLAKIIFSLIPKLKNKQTEIFHFSNYGYCSRYNFAKEINMLLGNKSKIISSQNLDSNLNRPKFSALESSKILNFLNLKNITWSDSLTLHIKKIQKNYINEI